MPSTETSTTTVPARLSALLDKATNAELLELILTAFEEGAERVRNYADLLDEPDAPEEAIDAGIAFGHRLDEVMSCLSSNRRASAAALKVYHALGRLAGDDEEAGDDEGDDDA